MVIDTPFSFQNYSIQHEHQVFSPSFTESPNAFRKQTGKKNQNCPSSNCGPFARLQKLI